MLTSNSGYIERNLIDVDLAQQQHQIYCETLRSCGARVVTLPSNRDLPDSVFVEDTAIIFDEIAVITSMGNASRCPELGAIEPEIARYRTTVRISLPATIEGGDVLKVGKTVYVGLSPRTNVEGISALQRVIKRYGYEVIAVTTPGCLHLKTGCTALDHKTILANSDWVDLTPFAGYDIIPLPQGEPWAANVLRVKDTLLMNAAFPKTIKVVANLGFKVCPVNISEFLKAEAGLTCMSLLFENAV